jgi:riboflavin synthase
MFTGIVEGTGTVTAVEAGSGGRRLRVEPDFAFETEAGASVAVSGVCLTVESHDGAGFEAFVAAETAERTYLGDLAAGDRVNLERALRAEDRLDGHVVQGHVDGTTTVAAVESVDREGSHGGWRYAFAHPGAPYVVEKGSIALDGVSLTVAGVSADRFEVAVIPETYERTTLGEKSPGDPVHVEYDVLAKYVEALC